MMQIFNIFRTTSKKNTEDCLITSIKNWLIPTKLSEKNIRICKKICERIISNFYVINLKKFQKKWGVIETIKVSIPYTKYYQYIDTNYNRLTDENNRNTYEKELLLAQELDIGHKNRDVRILFNILTKFYIID